MDVRGGQARHEQISAWIRDQIARAVYVPNDRLPSESALGSRFGVSRITVRRALLTLENEGLIFRRQGLGSFVRPEAVRQGLVRLTDFVEDMTAAGLVPSSRLLLRETEGASGAVAKALDIDEGKPVVRIDRLRLGDGEPVAFDRTWLPAFYGELLESHDLIKNTIYEVLEEEFDIPIVSGRYRIESMNAGADIAQHLAVPWGRALLLIERVSRTLGERPVYFQRRFYRSDRVAYELELVRDQPAGSTGPVRGMPLRQFEPVFRRSSGREIDQNKRSRTE